jgi:hypothetical protein
MFPSSPTARVKSLFTQKQGGVLLDDWDEHRELWISKGGRWITPVLAKQAIAELRALGF